MSENKLRWKISLLCIFIICIKLGSSLKCYVCNENDYITRRLIKRDVVNKNIEPSSASSATTYFTQTYSTNRSMLNESKTSTITQPSSIVPKLSETTNIQITEKTNHSSTPEMKLNVTTVEQYSTESTTKQSTTSELQNVTIPITNLTINDHLDLDQILKDLSINKTTKDYVKDVKDCSLESTIDSLAQRLCDNSVGWHRADYTDFLTHRDPNAWQCVLIGFNDNNERKYLRGCMEKKDSCDSLLDIVASNRGRKIDQCLQCTDDLCNDNRLLTRAAKPKEAVQRILVIKGGSNRVSNIGTSLLISSIYLLNVI